MRQRDRGHCIRQDREADMGAFFKKEANHPVIKWPGMNREHSLAGLVPLAILLCTLSSFRYRKAKLATPIATRVPSAIFTAIYAENFRANVMPSPDGNTVRTKPSCYEGLMYLCRSINWKIRVRCPERRRLLILSTGTGQRRITRAIFAATWGFL